MIYIISQSSKICDIQHSTSSKRGNELSELHHVGSAAAGLKGQPSGI